MAGSFEELVRSGKAVRGMSFSEKVWALTAQTPPGCVTTYGTLARALGIRGSRAVGQALNRNSYAPGVPCHWVVGRDRSLTGYGGGLEKKCELLRSERIEIAGGKVLVDRFFNRLYQASRIPVFLAAEGAQWTRTS
jgi:methylated-DNA-[protein]-cysteine S-methyltransferase